MIKRDALTYDSLIYLAYLPHFLSRILIKHSSIREVHDKLGNFTMGQAKMSLLMLKSILMLTSGKFTGKALSIHMESVISLGRSMSQEKT